MEELRPWYIVRERQREREREKWKGWHIFLTVNERQREKIHSKRIAPIRISRLMDSLGWLQHNEHELLSIRRKWTRPMKSPSRARSMLKTCQCCNTGWQISIQLGSKRKERRHSMYVYIRSCFSVEQIDCSMLMYVFIRSTNKMTRGQYESDVLRNETIDIHLYRIGLMFTFTWEMIDWPSFNSISSRHWRLTLISYRQSSC
jgi:hypothetical protein